MVKKVEVLSDLSGKVLDQVMKISIEVEGHTVQDKNGNFYNRIVMDIHPDEVHELIDSIKFIKPDALVIPKFSGDVTGQVSFGVKKNG